MAISGVALNTVVSHNGHLLDLPYCFSPFSSLTTLLLEAHALRDADFL